MRILLAEDEKELSNALVAILKHNNYSIDAVYDGAEALDYGLSGNYNVIILDIMMPKMNGLEVLKYLREKGMDTPILLLTAKSEIEDRISGLDMGADDYLSKPFAMGELLARIRAMTRRKSEYTPNVLNVSNIKLNKETYELSNDTVSIRLGNKEFQMLEMLMSNPKRMISTEQFMERIWGYDAEAEINVVWVYISYLRKRLVSLDAKVRIKAIRGIGYTLEEDK
ncbi:winged helix family two component transcriptional regulator [Mobilisporobacter senegalensis]|uniref:Stage 0 sporulation protein A homolog n=1 Tax=Mobilisporobacter senegalensis TaxID=1329262 RepID=A0A3N1XP82_9FIRM|nr:response regulator transcription factor [Mobilisporobacter senegalensis]ROR28473.1 winged helix family two component transcriptional regulator [Mobilisporobacter senegalensis]